MPTIRWVILPMRPLGCLRNTILARRGTPMWMNLVLRRSSNRFLRRMGLHEANAFPIYVYTYPLTFVLRVGVLFWFPYGL